MPLDPLVQALLDQMAANPVPLWQLTPEEARAAMHEMIDAIGGKGAPIGKVANLTMPGPGGELELRIFTPVAAGSEALPGLIYFHGGGFVMGDLDTHDTVCRILANEAGVRVIAVHYRRPPEDKFPAAVDDAIAAVNWIEANASSLGVDANRLAVGGDSAGGALAAVVAQQAKLKGGPKLSYQMLLFPVTDSAADTASHREFAEGYFLERNAIVWFSDHYLPAEADRNDIRLSPLRAADVSGLPPAYVMLAGYDPLHDEGLAYAEKLRDAGVPVTVADYPDMIHDFVMMMGALPQARPALNAAATALKAVLNPE